MNYLVTTAVVFAFVAMTGCRAISITTQTDTVLPDGTKITKVETQVDKSFTLGFSNGDGKVVDILDVSVSGVGK